MAASKKPAARGKRPATEKPSTKKAAPKKAKQPAPPVEDLSDKKRQGVNAILTTPTLVSAARKVGVSEQTIHNWLADPEFCTQLQAAHDEALTRAVWQLKVLSLDAVDCLRQELKAGTPEGNPKLMPNKDRVGVADKILTHVLRFLDAVETKARVEDLEQRINKLTTPDDPS